MVNNRPVYVFVHGAWQSKDAFNAVLPAMKKMGLTSYAIDLPGHGDNSTDFSRITLNTYVKYVIRALEKFESNNIVLIGHSMAGMVISEVSQHIKIKKLVYIAAFLPQPGESLINIADQFGGEGLSGFMKFDIPNSRIKLRKEGLERVLYNDCDESLWQKAITTLQDQPVLPFNGKVKLGDQFCNTPKEYIVCLQDRAITPVAQRSMCEAAKCKLLELDAGHEPMVSKPAELSLLINVD